MTAITMSMSESQEAQEATTQYYKFEEMKAIVCNGNIAEGWVFYGPFDNARQANLWLIENKHKGFLHPESTVQILERP